MKFAHIGDCHLGGWRHPELKELNLKSFQLAIKKVINEKVDFLLITGDLFDSSYPSIDVLKEAFKEFRKLSESKIPVYLIAGSHDYSVSGKTFLDVLEKAGFSKNVALFEERNGKIILQPTLHENVAIYGYPGKKSALEIDEIKKITLQDAPGFFKILMLHTTLKDAVGSLPVKAVDHTTLPKVDYLALSHLHINYRKENRVYSGPIFPNSLPELEELRGGSFYIFDEGQIKREEIKIKEVLVLNIQIENALTATDTIIARLKQENLSDKILLLKLFGILKKGKTADIDFKKVEEFAKTKGTYVFIKSTSKLHTEDSEIKIEFTESKNLENEIIEKFSKDKASRFNSLAPALIKSFQTEKLDDEKSAIFQERMLSEIKKITSI